MMRWIVGSSLRFRFLVVAMGAAMMLIGIAQLRTVPIDVFPEFAPPLVEIQTEAPGMSTSEVESLITIPLEDALSSTPQLDTIRSKSVPGLSAITLIFKSGTDILNARQLVSERVSVATRSLPTWAGLPWMLQPLSATSRVVQIGITSDKYSPMDLSMITYWTIRWRLMGVPGVANVVLWGDRFKQLQVQVDPHKLGQYHVSLDEAQEVTSEALDYGLLRYTSNSRTRVGGFVDTANQRLGIQHVLPVVTPEDLAKVPVHDKTKSDGTPLTLGDLGHVVWDHQPLIGDGVINDKQGLLLIVEKFPWANSLDVTRGVDAALNEMRPGLAGIQIDSTIFRQASFIEMAIGNLAHALLISCLLVVLVLGSFLFEWRTALISMVAIPLSLVMAGLILAMRGATINTMILAGLVIAVGGVVDDAIIDVENIVRRLRQARREGSTRSTASIILEASLEVRSAIVYAVLIDVTVLLPIFFVGGVTGAFFQPLALSYALALLASMVVALTVTPALCLMLLAKAPLERRESPLLRWLQRSYNPLVGRIIRSPRPAFAMVTLFMLAGLLIFPFLGESLFPAFKERDFLMHWVSTPGTSHAEAVRITTQASRELRAIPGVRNFGSHIGRAIAGEEVHSMNFAENWISVDPAVDYDKTVTAIEEVVNGYPGLFRDVQTYLNERIDEVLVGTSDDIVVRIFGPDLETLRSKAAEVKATLEKVPGTSEVHTELQVDVPHVQVSVNMANAQRYGLKPGDIRRAAAALVAGTEVSDIHRDGKVYDVMVVGTPETYNSLTNIREMLIDTPDGGQVRLSDVADVSILPTPNLIEREHNSRRIDVGIKVTGRDLGAVVHDVNARLRGVSFPLEYHAQVLGEYAERQEAQGRLFAFGLAAAIGVFLLLQAAFGSWRLATLAFFTLPSALVGGILAAFATGGIISLGSLVGFFTVFGIAARNGIMLINHYQHLEREEGMAFGPELVVRGARERLGPILMTALAAGLALVPLVISGDIPGHEIEHPMAIVILGGLVTSTILNLFVVPSLYLRFGKKDPNRRFFLFRNRPAPAQS
ncbi:MAG: CzcABC family efflux RND transporter, transmembrane protein [Ktedonobacterales bacterium]|jgi:CzcA family heavy metal efflux pump|nr:MAG: CzcABC family efflux RND transporter, transmembrane protein [Ktedonobacterales bacterium]